jgi:hypothetical protein
LTPATVPPPWSAYDPDPSSVGGAAMLTGRMAILSMTVKHKNGQRLPHSMHCQTSCTAERDEYAAIYFHLSTPDEDFADNIGSDVNDLADAHSSALVLAKRVTMFLRFAGRALDLRRWTVNVTDEAQRPVFTIYSRRALSRLVQSMALGRCLCVSTQFIRNAVTTAALQGCCPPRYRGRTV